jgi:hypothetical protein
MTDVNIANRPLSFSTYLQNRTNAGYFRRTQRDGCRPVCFPAENRFSLFLARGFFLLRLNRQ